MTRTICAACLATITDEPHRCRELTLREVWHREVRLLSVLAWNHGYLAHRGGFVDCQDGACGELRADEKVIAVPMGERAELRHRPCDRERQRAPHRPIAKRDMGDRRDLPMVLVVTDHGVTRVQVVSGPVEIVRVDWDHVVDPESVERCIGSVARLPDDCADKALILAHLRERLERAAEGKERTIR